MLIAVFISAVIQTGPITLTCKATSVAGVLALLSEQSKQPMRAAIPIANDIIIVAVKDQPIKTVMEKIAETTAGKWVTENGVSVLQSDPGALSVRQQAEIAARSVIVKKEQARIAATISNKFVDYARNIQELSSVYRQIEQLQDAADEKLYQRLQSLTEQLPGGTLLNRALVSFEPSVLAALPLGSRVVFAMTPTRMQRALPANAQAAARQFAKDHAQLSSAWKALSKEEREQASSIYMGSNPGGTPSEVLVAATRYQGDMIGLELVVLDEKGGLITQQSATIGSGSEFSETDETKRSVKPDEPMIALSDQAKQFQALLRADVGGVVPWERCPAELREKLSQPESNDPLSYATSEFILGMAAGKGKPFVCQVPDRALTLGSYLGSATASTVEQSLTQYGLIRLTEKDGWITGISPTASDDRDTFANRAALGNLIRTISKSGYANLDMLGSYARVTSVNQPYDGVYYTMIQGLFGPWLAGLNPSDLLGLRFYGSLTAGVRANLTKGMQVSSIGAEAQQNLSLYIYRQSQLSGSIYDDAGGIEDVSLMESFDLWNDPSEVLPTGIPPASLIKLSALSDDVVVPQGTMGSPLSAGDLASQTAMEERPDLFPWANENRLPGKFRMSKRQNYTFLFHFTPKLGSILSLMDVSPGAGPLITRNDLPADFKKTYDEQLKQMRDIYKDMKPGQGTRGGQPPPD